MTKEITLTRGQCTLVDDDDYESLSQNKWHVKPTQTHTFYATRWEGRKKVKMHNLLLPPPPGMEVDHINGNSLDNRKSNLRLATHEQNMYNQRKNIKNTSGFKGVHWDASRKKWMAGIKVKGKWKFLGRFTNIREAAETYDAAAIENYGEFARLNFPQGQPIGGPTY